MKILNIISSTNPSICMNINVQKIFIENFITVLVNIYANTKTNTFPYCVYENQALHFPISKMRQGDRDMMLVILKPEPAMAYLSRAHMYPTAPWLRHKEGF